MDKLNNFTDFSIPDPTIEYFCSYSNKSKGFTHLMKLVMMVNSYPDVMPLITELIKNNPEEINKQNNLGYTALMLICKNCYSENALECVNLLLDSGADVNLRDIYNNTIFTIMESDLKYEIFRHGIFHIKCKIILLSHHNTQLEYKDIYADFMSKQLDDFEQSFNVNDHEEKYIPLIVACSCVGPDTIDCIKVLIESGSDVNEQKDGFTPLLRICDNINEYSLECIKFLINCGADINAQDKDGFTPFLRICSSINEHSKECIKFLINCGADVNAQDKDGRTALILILSNCRYDKNEYIYDCIRLLLNCGADVNVRNNLGSALDKYNTEYNIEYSKSVLDYYCSKCIFSPDNLDIFMHIIRETDNITMKNAQGKTAYDYYKYNRTHTNVNDEYIESLLKGEIKL